MTTSLYIAWIVLQILFGYNLIVPIVLFVIWKFKKKNNNSIEAVLHEIDYGIIVTAFQQTHLLPSVVQSLLQLKYNNYIVYIVADNCDVSDLKFDSNKVILLKPEVTLASNTASHFYAIDHFLRPHTHITIIDSDNLVDPEYLSKLNFSFLTGVEAVQGLRKAKNLNSTYACLDAARDLYYHFYDGKLLYDLNSSATLSGSGMAFTTELYKSCFENGNVSGAGFDKVLQAAIVGKDKRIAFDENAIVYDEKTSQTEQLVKQRSRWINTWFKYFGLGFKILKKGIVNRSLNQLLFGFILLRPPLFIFTIVSLIFLIANFFISLIAFFIWIVAFILFIAGFLVSLRYANADKRIYQSLIGIPKFIFFQIISLIRSKNANKASVATIHYHDDRI